MQVSTALSDLSGKIGTASAGALSTRRGDQWREGSARLLREHFLLSCETLAPALLLELGAHGAETSVAFLDRVGGQAIAFEANPHTFAAKTRSAASVGVDVRNFAVADEVGQAVLHIPQRGGSRSLTPGSASLLRRVEGVEYTTVSVPATTIDAIVEGLDISGGVALWVDVEGLSYEVLRGGLDLLQRDECRIVMVEVEDVQLWEGQSTGAAIDQLMASLDFVPIMRDAEYESQYNVVYVKASQRWRVDQAAYWAALAGIRTSNTRWAYRRSRAALRSVARRTRRRHQ